MLSEMRDQQTCLIGLIPSPNDPSMGVQHWVMAEGGLATSVKKEKNGRYTATSNITMRRTPVTYRPDSTSCPKCLAAMERLQPPTIWSIRLADNWYIHETRALTELRESREYQTTLI